MITNLSEVGQFFNHLFNYYVFVLNVYACFSHHQSTPLHKAAERGRKDIVTYLVERGADVSIKDHDGVSQTFGDTI